MLIALLCGAAEFVLGGSCGGGAGGGARGEAITHVIRSSRTLKKRSGKTIKARIASVWAPVEINNIEKRFQGLERWD